MALSSRLDSEFTTGTIDAMSTIEFYFDHDENKFKLTLLVPKYAVTVKRHNVCKRHGFLDTGFKQTECTIFLCFISIRKIRRAL